MPTPLSDELRELHETVKMLAGLGAETFASFIKPYDDKKKHLDNIEERLLEMVDRAWMDAQARHPLDEQLRIAQDMLNAPASKPGE